MNAITRGFNRACKNGLGGFELIYLFPFVKYSRSQIVVDNQELIQFPTTTVYPFYVVSANLNEDVQEDKSVTQNLTFNAIKLEANTELLKLLKKDYRAIVRLRNGKYKLVGAYNGLISDLTSTTGASRSELSGYNITMQGLEKCKSLYFDDLQDVGFELPDVVIDNFVFMSGDNFVFMNGDNFILNG